MPPELTTMVESFLLRELRTLRLELELYADESLIWEQPPGLPNSAGMLALHVAGNLRHYIGAHLGATGYERDRDAEFAGESIPRATLLSEIGMAEADIRATLPGLTETQLSERFPEPIRGHWLLTREFLIHLAVHLGYHLGQVSYHRRLVTGEATGTGALSAAELSTAERAAGP